MSAPLSDVPRLDGFAAVIPAGGVGSRLWPLSRPERPKFLLDLLDEGRTLLQATVDRVAPLAAHTMVVTGVRHGDAVRAQLPDMSEDDVLTEPSPRDSMAAIALAAAVLQRRHGPLVMGSFAADHVIRTPEAFHRAVAAAVEAARAGKVVTLGITPTQPSEAFGYIKAGGELGGGAFHVDAFTEKPDAETAAAFIATGDYYWNAGMFVVRTDVLLGHLERLQPAIATGVQALAEAWDTDGRDEALARWWPTLTKIAIDHAIAEPVAAEGGVAVVPAPLEWYDVGDFAALASLLPARADGAVVSGRQAPVAALSADGAVVIGGDRMVAVVGIDDAVVVETPDALLVTTRGAAQRVKRAAEAAEALSKPAADL